MTTKYLAIATVALLIADIILLTFDGQIFMVFAFAALSAIGTIVVAIVAWMMKWDFLIVVFCCVGSASVLLWTTYLMEGRSRTISKIEFEGAYFGLEFIPDPSFSGYNETLFIFFVPEGEDKRKYISTRYASNEFAFNNFPNDEGRLEGHEFSIVDTVTRSVVGDKPTSAQSTLYINPKLFSRNSLATFSKFVQECYRKPDKENPILDWLNNYARDGKELHDSDKKIIRTIYAIVFASIDELEPVYVSPNGNNGFKITISDNVKLYDPVTEREGEFIGVLRNRVFYYSGPGFETDPNKLMTTLNSFGDIEHYRSGEKTFQLLYDSIMLGHPQD